jgi:hypothetical protein
VLQYGPAISPSGGRVAYVGAQQSGRRIWRNIFVKGIDVRALNRSGHRVLRRPLPRLIESVTFAPGGRRLVFSAVPRRGGPDLEIFTVRLGGAGLRQLTHNRVQDIEPTVSNTNLIAFAQMHRRGRPPRALFGDSSLALIRARWRGRRLLTRAARFGGEDRDPAFAPFGNRVAYERSFDRRPSRPRINEVDLRTRDSRTVYLGCDSRNAFRLPHNPAFSPGARAIVFDLTVMDAFGQITNPDLHAIGRGGGGLRHVTGLAGEYDTEPDWGPAR